MFIYFFKILIVVLGFGIIAGCATSQTSTKHWHSKTLHLVEPQPPTTSPTPGTSKHWHGKQLHKVEYY